MDHPPWRVDVMSGGAVAWVYVRPHEVAWAVPAASVDALGYTVTEERQDLVDVELGACVRYLAVKDDGVWPQEETTTRAEKR